MTQEVQPLTWQKRTNLEEHQQFFSKINEIIANLAPTVDEAEAAIAQAQTAANTVAGYNDRLTAVESETDTNKAKITAIEGRESDYLKKTGNAQTVTSQIMVPTTPTGVRDTQIANGARIQNDLAAYEPMVRLTGNASVYGRKAFNAISSRNVNGQGSSTSCLELFRFKATSGQDHRFNFFRHLGYGVCLTSLHVKTNDAAVEIIDGSKTPIGTSTGNITIGAGFTTDGWCIVYEKEESVCVFCTLLSAFTGSRFPIQEANIDMSQQCNIVDITGLSGVAEVTL